MFKLSDTSKKHLLDIDTKLVNCVKFAIEITRVDFSVTDGIRTLEEQQAAYKAGTTKTMESKHLDGKAVDLVPYVHGKLRWEINLCDDVADAMRQASNKYNVKIRWGGAWHIPDIWQWTGTMREANLNYIDARRGEGRSPFIDGPHFEI